MMDRLPINGSAEQLAAKDVYGVFATLFRDSYFHAEIGIVDDSHLQELVSLFGVPWSDLAPVMTVVQTDSPRFIANTADLIPAHNECAYTDQPPRMLALYCVENNAEDGAFFAVSPAQLMDEIGVEFIPSLRAARFSCQMSADRPPISTTLLRNTPGGEQLIFTSVPGVSGGLAYQLTNSVDEYSSGLLSRVYEVVNDPNNRHRHSWRQGDLIVLDNLRLMHGREAFHGGQRELRHLRLA